ncbi:unnamed protein product [Closterium sp. NIES-65]|nr:unnamed protein product [Closterium sp. NIES-65]CAI5945523.1 unnamed protein product [Closterium sp. NIES-65]CAI5950348.1 unnamed protein product [Closterium sp. NIES-65]
MGAETVGSKGDLSANGRICQAVYDHFFHIPYESSLLPLARLLAPFLTESVRLDGDYNVFYHSLVSSKNLGAPTSAYIGQGLAGKGGSKPLPSPSLLPLPFSRPIFTTILPLSHKLPPTIPSAPSILSSTPHSRLPLGHHPYVPSGVVEAHLNGSNAGLAAATNSSGSLSLAVFHSSPPPPSFPQSLSFPYFSPQYLYSPLPSPLILSPSPAAPHSTLTFFQSHTANCGPSIRTCPSSAQCLSLLVPPCPSSPLLASPCPSSSSLPLLAPPCLSLPLLVLLAPPRPSLATLPLSNTTTNNATTTFFTATL